MQPRTRRWLSDIRGFGDQIEHIVSDRSLEDYRTDQDLRDIVERNLQKIGELVVRLHAHDRPVANRIQAYRGLIGLRNIIVHEYERLSDDEMWDLLRTALPVLLEDVRNLLPEDEEDPSPG